MTTRRQFLLSSGKLALGTFGASLLGCSPRSALKLGGPSYTIAPWSGDSFPPMHLIRDGLAPQPPPPSSSVDVVIVGGGISGLTAAYKLRDTNMLLLEREMVPGGNARGDEFQGIPHSIATAYIVDTEDPYGTLYDEIGIPLNPVEEPVDLLLEGNTFRPIEESSIGHEFERLKQAFRSVLSGNDFPVVPLAEASQTALNLDRFSMFDYLKGEFSEDLIKLIDSYCHSALGGNIRETSAYAAVNFYSEIVSPIYAFPGGNSYIAKKLISKIEQSGSNRIKTGIGVFSVQPKGDRVHVSYFNHDGTEPITVSAKAAVIAAPYLISSRICHGLSADTVATMRSLSYGSYLVANFCFKRRVFEGGYDHWVPGSEHFVDFVDADYVNENRSKHTKQVLTVYAPYQNPLFGRYELLSGEPEMICARLEESLRQVIGYSPSDLEEIRPARYGHQILQSKIGAVTAMRNLKKVHGPIILAHSDGQAMASIESAMLEGLSAEESVRKRI